MSVEGGGISVSAPSIGPSMGPAISGPSFGPSLGGFSAPDMDIGPIMSGPSFSFVNEGPAPVGGLESFSPFMPTTPDLGGTIGPIEALNLTFPIVETRPFGNIFNEGPVPVSFLENTRPLTFEDFSYNPGIKVEIIANPFYEETQNMVWETPSKVMRANPKTIEIGIAQPLVEEEEETQVQLEAVREQLRRLQAKTSQLPRTIQVARPDQSTQPQVVMNEQVIQVIKEQKKEEKAAFTKEKQKAELRQKRLIVDRNALAARLSLWREAIKNAYRDAMKRSVSGNNKLVEKEEDKVVVTGEQVTRYIPFGLKELRSGILKKVVNDAVPDGSEVLNNAKVLGRVGKSSSQEEMELQINQIIMEDKPVDKPNDEEGEEATKEQNDIVHMFVLGSKHPVRWNEVVNIREERVETETTRPVSTGNTTAEEVPIPAESIGIPEEQREEQTEPAVGGHPVLREIFPRQQQLKLAA